MPTPPTSQQMGDTNLDVNSFLSKILKEIQEGNKNLLTEIKKLQQQPTNNGQRGAETGERGNPKVQNQTSQSSTSSRGGLINSRNVTSLGGSNESPGVLTRRAALKSTEVPAPADPEVQQQDEQENQVNFSELSSGVGFQGPESSTLQIHDHSEFLNEPDLINNSFGAVGPQSPIMLGSPFSNSGTRKSGDSPKESAGSGTTGNITPRKTTPSPRKPSPRKTTRSPRKPSPRKNTPSPRKRSPTKIPDPDANKLAKRAKQPTATGATTIIPVVGVVQQSS